MRALLLIVLLLVIPCSLGADAPESPQPKSPAATAAIAKSDVAIKKAEDQFRAAKMAALKQLAIDLRNAMGIATKAGNLEEANAVKSLLDTTQADVDALANVGKAQRFVIDARKDWQPTIEVRKGQRVSITSTGAWTHRRDREPYNADGFPGQVAPGFDGWGKLIGKIGSDEFPIGLRGEIDVTEDGTLMLKMKDDTLEDNSGELRIIVAFK